MTRLLAALLLSLLVLSPLAAKKFDDEAWRARKADYLFLEAMRARALDERDRYAALIERAAALTPNRAGREVYEAASMRLSMLSRADSAEVALALEQMDAYIAEHPAEVVDATFLAQVYISIGKPERALEIYETLERHKPHDIQVVAGHAEVLLALERYDEAIATYQRLEKAMGPTTTLTQRVSNIYIWQGDTAAALDVVDTLITQLPRDLEPLQLGAAASVQFGRPAQALVYVDRALALDPSDGRSYFYASQAYRALGRMADYERAIDGAIRGDDLDIDTKIELLRNFLAEEVEADTAAYAPGSVGERMLQNLVGIAPHNGDARRLYMAFLMAHRQWGGAAEQLEYALDADPADEEGATLLPRLYSSADLPDEALRAARQGLQRFPANIEMRELTAGILTHAGREPEAIQTLQEGLELDSLTPTEKAMLYRDIADTAQRMAPADTALVEQSYERSLELNPDDDLAMNNYAYWMSNAGGDLLRAKELIAKAVVYTPGSATYYDTYAWVLFRLGQLEEAKRYIDMALLTDRSHSEGTPEQMAEVLGHAAEIYQALGQKEKAKEYRQRAEALTKLSDEETK